nr:unnamed protein product [Digitaria exilis]
MDRRRWFVKAAAVMLLLLLSMAPPGAAARRVGSTEPNTKSDVRDNGQSFVFNYTLAKAIEEYASAGFKVTCIIVDVQNCLQAFVGVDHNLNAIIVAIRGTQENSVQNWIKDMIWKQVDLNYPNMPNAKVWEHTVNGKTVFQVCDGSGEDPNCSRSVFVLFWSASDHLTYMGVKIEADDWSTCRIVLGQSVEQLRMNLASNIVTTGRSVDVVIADDSVQVD